MEVVKRELLPRESSVLDGRTQSLITAAPVGTVGEVLVLQQFDDSLSFIAREIGGPRSFCGATAPAVALAIFDTFCDTLQWGQNLPVSLVLDALLPVIRDRNHFIECTRRALRFIMSARHKYISAHSSKFNNPQRKKRYLKAWIANYEISDYLRAEMAQRKVNCGGDAKRLLFFRKNQWPLREKEAKFEEYERLEEERRFGGRLVSSAGDVTFNSEMGDCSVIVEVPSQLGEDGFLSPLLKPVEFLRDNSHRDLFPKVAVVDLNGHYAAALCCYDEHGIPTTILFNTTSGGLARPQLLAMHDLVFFGSLPLEKGESGPVCLSAISLVDLSPLPPLSDTKEQPQKKKAKTSEVIEIISDDD